jgi:hypothetical protein
MATSADSNENFRKIKQKHGELLEDRMERVQEYVYDFIRLFFKTLDEMGLEVPYDLHNSWYLRIHFGYNRELDSIFVSALSISQMPEETPNFRIMWASKTKKEVYEHEVVYRSINLKDNMDFDYALKVQKEKLYSEKDNIPNFARLMNPKFKKVDILRKEVAHSYYTSHMNIPTIEDHKIPRSLHFIEMLVVWLRFHSPEYL